MARRLNGVGTITDVWNAKFNEPYILLMMPDGGEIEFPYGDSHEREYQLQNARDEVIHQGFAIDDRT